MLLASALIVTGLIALVFGSELVLAGGSRMAALLGVRPIVIGLTIVSVGTSTPELAVGITASLQGSGSLAIGNIAGTNIFNLLFILGLSALIRPLPMQLLTLRLDLPVMLLSAVAFLLMSLDHKLSQLEGALLLAGAVLYTWVLLRLSRRESPAMKAEFAAEYQLGEPIATDERVPTLAFVFARMALGLALVVGGAQVMVQGAIDAARLLGVSDAVIGLTIVALGTSAPELVTTVMSTLKGERDIAVGNLLGSSTYNILAILGLTCFVSPGGIRMEEPLLHIDLGLAAAVVVLCVPVFLSGKVVSRAEGLLFVSLYLAYFSWLLWLHT